MFVLSYVLPPMDGAKYGKATVLEPVITRAAAADMAGDVLIRHGVRTLAARAWCNRTLWEASWNTDVKHEQTGITFRISDENAAPNACPCCGRLVELDDHAFGGRPDAYCLGCYTWGDSSKIECSPHESAHPNPWGIETVGSTHSMEIVFDLGDETGHDIRYTTGTTHEMWDDEDNALIAWPGLTRKQIISVEIKEV